MSLLAILGCIMAGVGLTLVLLSMRNLRHMYCPNWLLRAMGEVPWAPGLARHMRAVPNQGMQPTHEVYFVPRQEIAECGVACPKCGSEVAERGDFSRIMRANVDGEVNEVVKCIGMIDLGDGTKPVPCSAWLVASPNTEHGDHLLDGNPAEFYTFNRITNAQVLRERYGIEISGDSSGLQADADARPEGSTPSHDLPGQPIPAVFARPTFTAIQPPKEP